MRKLLKFLNIGLSGAVRGVRPAAAACLLAAAVPVAVEAVPERTLVVANEAVADSVALAEYYMERRGIPSENLYLLSAPRSETIGWDQFVESIYNPLRTRLIEDRWLQGTIGDRRDPDGRLLHATSGHRIEDLVLCYGMPLRIRHDDARLPEEIRERIPEALRTNRGAVDSELALLSHTSYGINAYQRNPVYAKREPAGEERAAVIRVARLDGPSLEAARNLVDSALEAEEKGLRGRAYIDFGGPHEKGDEWLEEVERQVRELGFDLSVADSDTNLEAAARFEAPALYFGWYAADANGPFALDGFRFPPGAVAVHIHSFSATTVRSERNRWVGPFVAKGVAATVGNVFEPYLELTHRPDLFFEALVRGRTLGEAAAYSMPVLSWQGVVVGDPLYRPFAVDLERQLAAGEDDGESNLRQYAVIRKMNLLERAGDREEAIRYGESAYAEDSRIPLAFALASLHAANGDGARGRELMAFVRSTEAVSDLRAGALLEMLSFLNENAAADLAVEGFQRLIDYSDLSPPVRGEVLRRGARVARDAGENRLYRRWNAERARLDDG